MWIRAGYSKGPLESDVRRASQGWMKEAGGVEMGERTHGHTLEPVKMSLASALDIVDGGRRNTIIHTAGLHLCLGEDETCLGVSSMTYRLCLSHSNDSHNLLEIKSLWKENKHKIKKERKKTMKKTHQLPHPPRTHTYDTN